MKTMSSFHCYKAPCNFEVTKELHQHCIKSTDEQVVII